MKHLFLVLALLTSTTSGWASDESTSDSDVTNPILNFHEIVPGLYRGARPELAGVKKLAELGFKTIINIDNQRNAIDDEKKDSSAVGINMISVPLSGFNAPSDKDINKILALMNDPTLYPAFVHCEHGNDRTGLVSGLFRVEVQKWSPADAYKEMIARGFHRILFLLDEYYKNRTGLTLDPEVNDGHQPEFEPETL